jgi:hypothetical protein
MRSRRPKVRRHFAPVAIVIASLLVLDLAATIVVHVRAAGALPDMPVFNRSALAPTGSDPYLPALPLLRSEDLRVRSDGQVRLMTAAGPVFDPETSARFAISELEKYGKNQDRVWLLSAVGAMAEVAARAPQGISRRPSSVAPPWMAHPRGKGWVSAQCQGIVLSAFSRLAAVTGRGRARWEAAAHRVFGSLLRFRGYPGSRPHAPDPWFSFVDSGGYLWFDLHGQDGVPTSLLTSHVFALFGLSDYLSIARRADRRAASALLAGGVDTARHYAQELRSPFMVVRISPTSYERSSESHRILALQMGRLGSLTADPRFNTIARQLWRDIAVPYFRTTGIRPQGDVDAYAAGRAGHNLPPTQQPNTPDLSGSERAQRTGNPDARIARAIIDLESYRDTGDTRALRRARAGARHLMATWRNGLVPHRFPATNVYGEPLQDPWYSAQTQGLLLSALVRLAEATGERRWGSAASTVFATLLVARNAGDTLPNRHRAWLLYIGDEQSPENVWFEKYPAPDTALGRTIGHPSFVIDAHLATVIGVYDYWRLTSSRVAARLFDGGVSTILARANEIRVPGDSSRTDLQSTNTSLEHHRVVTLQLEAIAKMTSDPRIGGLARDLAEDAR